MTKRLASHQAILRRRHRSGLFPETIAYRNRVLADGGEIIDIKKTDDIIRLIRSYGYDSNVLALCSPYYGVKKDVSNKISTVYSPLGGYDLEQLTGAAQPDWEENADGRKYISSTTTTGIRKVFANAAIINSASYFTFQKSQDTFASENHVDMFGEDGVNSERIQAYNDVVNNLTVRPTVSGATAGMVNHTITQGSYNKVASLLDGSNHVNYFNTIATKTTVASTGWALGAVNLSLNIGANNTGTTSYFQGRTNFYMVLDTVVSEAFVEEVLSLFS